MRILVTALRKSTLVIFPILIGIAAEDFVVVGVSFFFFLAYDLLVRAEFVPEVSTPSQNLASAQRVIYGDEEGLK